MNASPTPRPLRHALAAAALAALGACTTPLPSPPIDPKALTAERLRMTTLALAGWDAEVARVDAVAQRLLGAALARGLCAPTRPDRGLRLEAVADLPDGLAAEVRSAGLRARGLAVVAVDADGPAAQAGVRPGDRVLALDGAPLAPGAAALPPAWGGDRPVTRALDGAGGPREAVVGTRARCDARVLLDASHDLVASTDAAGTVHIAQGMVQALTDDASLAFVIGHELGHRAHGDSAAIRLFDASGSQDQERRADRFGIELVHAAGYDVHQVADVWDRLARLDPDRVGQNPLRDHPLRAERNLRLREAIVALDQHS